MNNGLVQNWERSTSRLHIVTLLNLYAQYIMRNARLDDYQAGNKTAGRNIYNLRYADDTTLMAENRGTKESLDKCERGEWKSRLKTQHSKNEDHGIQSHHFMANIWGNNEEVTDFIFLGSKITADYVYSHEIKRRLLLGRKAMTNLVNILKSRDITDKGLYSQSYGFSSRHVWIWELEHKEGWAPKNWCFWTVVLKKTLESPLDC